MTEVLQQYGPTQPIAVLVAELNKLYHEHEAASYESTHPEIFEQLPPLWREMLAQLNSRRFPSKSGRLRILDVGCGTGFEATQCLAHLGIDQVERIVCYDPSKHMLDRCRRVLSDCRTPVEFLTDLSELTVACGTFDLLITNSVLHHLVDPVRTIRDILPFLSPHAFWLSGHEPSRRFFRNPECRELLRRYHTGDRWRRLLSPRRCARRLMRWTGVGELPQDYAARRAFEQSMFKRQPPARLVSELVDFQVVASESTLSGAAGLDFRDLQTAFAGEWELLWRRSYSFLGPHYQDRLSARWRIEAVRLAEKHPDDGANCCLVWRRSSMGQGI